MASPKDAANYGKPGAPAPEEELSIAERLDLVEEEKRRALADPGPSWTEWFLYSGAKWWMGLLFLIIDVWVIVTWIELGSLVLLLASLVLVSYAEFLLWRYLWYRPSEWHRDFHATWFTPVRFGRWTPEGAQVRAGTPLGEFEDGPNPHEFL